MVIPSEASVVVVVVPAPVGDHHLRLDQRLEQLARAVLRYKRGVRVSYTTYERCFGAVKETLRSHLTNRMAVCDLGGGANPVLAREDRVRLELDYTVLDADPGELAKAPTDVKKVEADITAPTSISGAFDVIVSKQLLEHVRRPAPLHRNVRGMLRTGGVAIHFFPTLYAAPFLVNRLLPERIGERVVLRLQPFRVKSGAWGKFPAYYRWCRGPTPRQLRRLAGIGYEIEEYLASFGHAYYSKAPPLQRLEDAKARLLLRHPVPTLTSYAVVVLRKI